MNPVPGLPIVCLGCGCLCDDIPPAARFSGNQWPASAISCELGREWLGRERPAFPPSRVGGKPASLEQALTAAAELLASASSPLVCGWAGQTLEGQRAAVALADRLGALADWTSGPEALAHHAAFQQQGASTATLGEVRRRADLVVYWGCDPRESHPRHLSRFVRPPDDGASPRRVWCVSDDPGADFADERAALLGGDHLATLAALRMLIRGEAIEASAPLRQLASALTSSGYVAVFYSHTLAGAGHAGLGALAALCQELHAHTRCVALPLGAQGNPHGAESVLAWQTGYPAAVSFASGAPRYAPQQYNTAALLTGGRVDAALVAGDDLLAHTTPQAAEALRAAPYVALGYEDSATLRAARVAIAIAEPGAACGGTVLRVDGVPLELRPFRDDQLPTAAEVLTELLDRITPPRLTS
ncbi:Formyltransferase/hydrolase complex Fhc subunit B [Pirellulimonas nuda]|uniref:Formyltransferase/hydrolase complex Fhc subunit B n=1 Tax=Pirellulimonas nuda TaxID=2528009 RepID=A0A518D8E4_9BACT|nr:hypothetical protein [Pirellulimonas nuda]QDU87733.1 Formyltransferase/hydrolase complex Fhc subunit B [Pirellulimonas nuda]